MKKAVFFLFATFIFLSAKPVKNTFSLKQIQKPDTAVQEVLKLFKSQIKVPITKMIIKIPYNINYSITLNSTTYYVIEYKIRILFKPMGAGLVTDEKDYIIRFLVNVDTKKVAKEEIYILNFTKNFTS